MARWQLLALWLGLAAAALPPREAHADAEEPAASARAVQSAMQRLASPLEGERLRGSAHLQVLLKGPERPKILAALSDASEAVQQELVAVFAADAGSDAVTALLRHLVGTGQPNDVLLALARTPAVVKNLGPKLAKDEGAFAAIAKPKRGPLTKQGKQRLNTLAALIRRAELEALLVSRKSPTGGTGYYQGQYDVLAKYGHRKLAVAVCTSIALDEAIDVPGIFTGGVYDFLHPHDVDILELRGMAINAVTELATAEDKDVIARLDAKLIEQWRDVVRRRAKLNARSRVRRRSNDKEFQDAVFMLGDDVSEVSDYLLCLYLLSPDTYRSTLDEFLYDLENNWDWPVRPQHVDGMIPAVLIRARRYEEAVSAYHAETIRFGSTKSFAHYNLACAYACWSRDPGDEDADRLKRQAVYQLKKSFSAGWRDLGWMEQDRDLDPIRELRGYRDVVRWIKEDLDLK